MPPLQLMERGNQVDAFRGAALNQLSHPAMRFLRLGRTAFLDFDARGVDGNIEERVGHLDGCADQVYERIGPCSRKLTGCLSQSARLMCKPATCFFNSMRINAPSFRLKGSGPLRPECHVVCWHSAR